jgi:hypothetical protein
MNKKTLRQMIIQECGCMMRDGEMPASVGSHIPLMDILGYGDGGEVVKVTGQHDHDDGIEYEDSDSFEESSMVRNNLFTMAGQASKLHDMIESGDDLPEWVQEKLAVAASMLDTVHDYLTAEMAHQDMHEAKRKPWYMKKRRGGRRAAESHWYEKMAVKEGDGPTVSGPGSVKPPQSDKPKPFSGAGKSDDMDADGKPLKPKKVSELDIYKKHR